jgi:hypothetical protein
MIEDVQRIAGWIFAVVYLFFSSAITFQIVGMFEFDEKDDSQLIKAFCLFLICFSFIVYVPHVAKKLVGIAEEWYSYFLDLYYDKRMGKFDFALIQRIHSQINTHHKVTKDREFVNKIKEFSLPRWAASALLTVIHAHIAEAMTVDIDEYGLPTYKFHKVNAFINCKFGETSVDIDVKVIGLKVRILFKDPVDQKIQMTILEEIIKNHQATTTSTGFEQQ